MVKHTKSWLFSALVLLGGFNTMLIPSIAAAAVELSAHSPVAIIFSDEGLNAGFGAQLLFQDGKLVEALTATDQALELLLPSEHQWMTTDLFILRGRIHRLWGNHAQAFAELDQALNQSLSDEQIARVQAERGMVFAQQGDNTSAIAALDAAIEFYETASLVLDEEVYVLALMTRGETHLALGNGEFALTDLNRAIAQGPDYLWQRAIEARAIASLSLVYRQLGQTAEADANLQQALTLMAEILTHYAQTWQDLAQLGRILRLYGEFDQAQTHLQAALDIAPDVVWIENELTKAQQGIRQ